MEEVVLITFVVVVVMGVYHLEVLTSYLLTRDNARIGLFLCVQDHLCEASVQVISKSRGNW